MATTKEFTKIEALSYFDLDKLPRKHKDGEEYAEAIALALKTDGKEYYVVQGVDKDGNIVVKKDFEGTYGIVRLLEIYPVTTVKVEIDGVPLSKAKKQDKVNWIRTVTTADKHDVAVDEAGLQAMTMAELDKMVIRYLRFREAKMRMINQGLTRQKY